MKAYTLAELRTQDDRREHIADMMLRGEWKGSASRRELADAWGIRRAELHELENAAIGACRLAVKETWPAKVAEALAELDAVKAAAWQGDEDGPQLKIIVEAVKLQLKVYGALGQPQNGKEQPADGEYDKLTHAERARRLREAADAEDAAAKGGVH